jgi:hypothetical protein
MSEKPESDDFDEDEDGAAAVDSDIDVVDLIEDLDKRPKNQKVGEPAWRRLERLREERETAALLSDFDDYDIDDDEEGSR